MQQDSYFFDFDIEIDTSENDYYKLLLDLPLRNDFKMKIGKSNTELKYIGIPKFRKDIEGRKCLYIDGLIKIPSYGNIKTRSGKLSLELYPKSTIDKKQYIFIHNHIQYPSTNISIWIEHGSIWLHDIKGIKQLTDIDLKLDMWNNLDIDFNGSFYTSDYFYIGDLQEGMKNCYIRNFRIFKN